MEPEFTIVYSPDEDGYYAEFYDAQTGKDLYINGIRLETNIYPERYIANKRAKRALRALNSKPKLWPLLSVEPDYEICQDCEQNSEGICEECFHQ